MLASVLLIAALADTVPGTAQRSAEAMPLDPQESIQLDGRLHWIIRPGSDLYLVYTHNWNEFAGDRLSGQRGMTSKISYTHRF